MADESSPPVEALSMDQRLDVLKKNVRLLFPEEEKDWDRAFPVLVQIKGLQYQATFDIDKVPCQRGIEKVYKYYIYLESDDVQEGIPEGGIKYSIKFNQPEDGRQHLIQELVRSRTEGGVYRTVNYDPRCYHTEEQAEYSSKGTLGEVKIVSMMEQAVQCALQGRDGVSHIDVSGTAEN